MKAWHRDCYQPRIGDIFAIAKLADYDNGDKDELEDKNEVLKFTIAHNGNNFVSPFECDLF